MSSSAKRDSRLPASAWPSIDDMPVFWWWRLHATQDPRFLLEKQRSVNGKLRERLLLHWRELTKQYIERFGLAENAMAILRKRVEIATLVTQHLMGEPGIETFIDIARLELAALQKGTESSDPIETKIFVEKHLGFAIDARRMPVSEYYVYLNNAIEHDDRKRQD